MCFAALLKTARRHRISENEKESVRPDFLIKPLDQQFVLMVEHRAQANATDVAIGRPVNRVAECHVIGGHRFRNRARSAANVKKAARHLLPGPDFGKRAVTLGIEIDLERLLTCSDIPLRFHNFQDVGICSLLNRRLHNAVIPSEVEGFRCATRS